MAAGSTDSTLRAGPVPAASSPSSHASGDCHKEFLRVELAELRADLHAEFHRALRQQTQWMIGVMVTLVALVASIGALTGG